MLSIDRTAEEVEYEDLVKVTIGDDQEKFFKIGSQLPQKEREELVEFLKQTWMSLPGMPTRPQE